MTAVLGLLLILAGVSHGIETSCDARQNVTECYGALGGTVYLQLIDNTTGLQLYLTLNDSKIQILKYQSNKSIITDERVHFIINNGTLKISNTGKNHYGLYKLEGFNENSGKTMWTNTFQLSIEAPVSSPQLSSECLSLGEMRVSCSSGGDSLQYTWTLDGHTLDDSTVSSGEGRSSVTLKRGMSGQLSCTVNNHVSQDTKNIDISTCNGLKYINCTLSNGTDVSDWVKPTGENLCTKTTTAAPSTQTTDGKGSTPVATSRTNNPTIRGLSSATSNAPQAKWDFNLIIIVVASLMAVVLLLAVMVGVYCVLNRRKAAPSTEEDEVTYASVKFAKKKKKQEKKLSEKEAPAEVEYGEVKVSGTPRGAGYEKPLQDVEYGEVKIMASSGRKVDRPDEHCVYSSIRKDQ